MSETNLAAQLSALILNQQHLTTGLKSLLEQEQQLLLENDSVQMMSVIQQKEDLAQQMATTQNQLNTLAQQYNQAEPEQRLVKLIQAVDPTGQLLQQWETLLDGAKACKQLNETNGATINLKKRYADNGLAILRGQTGNRNSTTYSKKGVETRKQGSHILHKA
ncbi:MAG: hypothetical protein HN382_04480 [Gammaproteobacteria bacterium]|jgi:flagellar biosynthesis/type III secretory pathway chaperone|nr:hypothetical protein [Gammaproteobacteria bacterium]MBT4607909.1 hypothetical protein [Thiotrichales bacterium]MBT3471781.1 hypothetical protein [Gammaproteobacteria bacterium]MBT3966530.1 hypothetical protein [Gammaproteobacteria bacterium]MBT4080886.1 hypothetical protein [Gammaproteobacteria bacterium]